MWDFNSCEDCGYNPCRCPRVTGGTTTMDLNKELNEMLAACCPLLSGGVALATVILLGWAAAKWTGAL